MQAMQQLAQEVGLQLFLLGAVRLLLLVALLCADAAFCLFLFLRLRYNIETSLAIVVVFNTGLALLAVFCAVRMLNEDKAKNLGWRNQGRSEVNMAQHHPDLVRCQLPFVKNYVVVPPLM